ncbi:YncE family protein [Streptomyces cirratus]|uniref:YncE family protein n=1 Tax=Streptomyces cirratus TaxID=68187 RepID=UPI00167D862B|nr:hypothetical protein [Streptomyces cirratus]
MRSDDVSVISTRTREVTRTVDVGDSPLGLAVLPDGTRLYVANAASDDLSVIETAVDGHGPHPGRSATRRHWRQP